MLEQYYVLWSTILTVCRFMSRTPLSLTGLKYWEWSLTVNLTSVCRGNWSLVWTLNTSTCATVVFSSLAKVSLNVTSRLEDDELELWNVQTTSHIKHLQPSFRFAKFIVWKRLFYLSLWLLENRWFPQSCNPLKRDSNCFLWWILFTIPSNILVEHLQVVER